MGGCHTELVAHFCVTNYSKVNGLKHSKYLELSQVLWVRDWEKLGWVIWAHHRKARLQLEVLCPHDSLTWLAGWCGQWA